MTYEALGEPRFVVDSFDGAEVIRIKARRQIFALIFLSIWLTFWTFGGLAAMAAMLRHFSPFLVVWLCGWAVGWCFASVTVAWMFFGYESLRVVDRDLEISLVIGPWSRRKLYQGGQIRALKAAATLTGPFSANSLSTPFMRGAQGGAVQFTYGARVVKAAMGLDEAEGALIVDRLARWLPASAVKPA